MKDRERPLIPAARQPRAVHGRSSYSGNYPDWESAVRVSDGYAAGAILAKAVSAMSAVRRGEAVHERDTVLFDEIEYSYPLLAALLYAASQNGNHLCVLDFGGALGSSYMQNRQMLAYLERLRWHIVEQPHIAAAGRRQFENDELRFFDCLEGAAADGAPDIALMCSVLPYVPDPFALIGRVKALLPRIIVVDRTPVLESAPTRLTVQTVPPQIYDASYPCWILNRGALLAAFAGEYRTLGGFAALGGPVDLGDVQASCGGWLFERL
jgi:putative methyltransferase (TIGR04325 family)